MRFFSIYLLFESLTLALSVKLQVHLIPHSHDDPGWLKTVDQYYTGSNSSIYLASVQYIFDSVVKELSADIRRHYSMCEISFFSRWFTFYYINNYCHCLINSGIMNNQRKLSH